MLGIKLLETLNRQKWLDQAGETMQNAVTKAYQAGGAAGRQLQDLLHGTWLGHPLHPVLTDLTLGAYTTAIALDALDLIQDDQRMAPAADASIALGLVSTLGTALSGLTDYQYADGEQRTIGITHALLNVSASLCYTGSWIARRQGARASGQLLGALGFTISSAAAYLGGDLVFRLQMGVNQAPIAPSTEGFVAVLGEGELAEGQLRMVEAAGLKVVLARQGGTIYALANDCSHMAGPLAEGQLEECSVRCPWHGSRFDLRDGRVLDGPATYPQPCFETRVRNGQIEVRATPPQEQREVGA